jgi:PIN domain nuclease of toxin-antitoxin system
VRYLLDTVTFLFAAQSLCPISARAARLLEDEESIRLLSAISISEIAVKNGIGKLDFTWQQVLDGVSDLKIEILLYTEGTRSASSACSPPQRPVRPADHRTSVVGGDAGGDRRSLLQTL